MSQSLNQRISLLETAINIRAVVMGKIGRNGENERTANCSVTRTDVGSYTCSFNTPRPTPSYVISLSIAEDVLTRDDIIIQVALNSTTINGFSYLIHEQDNSTTEGIYRDRPHFILVSDFD